MGVSKSRLCILSYEEAEKRITNKELNRLKRAFNEYSQKKMLSFDKFCSEVFGSFLPSMVSNTIFKALNSNNTLSGINFKELFIGIVILTKGTYEEKCKFFFSLYCNESASGIELEYIRYAADKTTSKDYIASVRQYLDENSILPFDNYMKWIKENPAFNEISKWLLTSDFKVPLLTDDSVPLDIYQLVAGVTHLDELEIIELEKTYHRLVFNLSKDFNLCGFTDLVCPPLPESIVEKVFRAFDENNDGIIDFNELVCGISACCRGPKTERKKFCCKIFNKTMDGKFTRGDIEYIFQICEEMKYNESIDKTKSKSTIYCDLITSILSSVEMMTKNYISIDDLLIWINDYDFLDPFLNLMNQICMIVFGLKPKNIFEEELIITQWLLWEQKLKVIPYDHVYIINKSWMNQWINSFRLNNSEKEDYNKDSANKSNQTNTKISHSISMNNVFAINRKHQYDIAKSNKALYRENAKNQMNGRFVYCTKIDVSDDIVQNIYPDIISIGGDHSNSNGSCNSMSSFSSSTSYSDISRPNKLTQINNQNLLQINNFKLASNFTILTEDGGVLSPTLRFNEDFEILPPPIWNCFHNWYGADISIKRPIWTETRDISKSAVAYDDHSISFRRYQTIVKVEIKLLTLFIMKHVLPSVPTAVNGLSNFNQFGFSSIGLSGGSMYKEFPSAKRQIAYRASFSHRTRITDLIELLSKKLNINREEMRIWKVIDENNLTLIDDEDKLLQDLCLRNFDKILVEQRNIDLTWPEELNQLVTLKSLQNRKASVSKGVTGLSNIGNTCFFNSAIQCISNTNILTEYFIRDVHLCEINKTNPQGCQGIVALRYGELIKDIWTGSTNLIVPLKLKMTMDKYAKQFSGNQQHDAQELLSVLLDALHEDLNRIDAKPSYRELKDSNGRHDDEVAQEAWQAHIATNFSIVVDLFHGLLKSNVCCDICKTNSVRFDAYSMLSLPIPMQLNQDFEILVFERLSAIPKKYCVLFNTIDSTSSFICEQVSRQLSVEPNSILLVSIEDNKIKKFLNPNDRIYLTQTLYAYIFEDTECSEINKNGSSPSTQENLIKFVIYHRKLIQKANYFMAHSRTVTELFGYPIVLTVRKDDIAEITNQDIQDKVAHILNNQIFHSHVYPADQVSVKQNSPIPIIKPNHALDCDSVNQRHPFVLAQVNSNIKHCSICHWSNFCNGCPLPNNSDAYNTVGTFNDEQYLAIDWSMAALHLSSNIKFEKKFLSDDKNKNAKSTANQPMDLIKCIESFTTQEMLDKDTLYQCFKCKKPQRAYKKLDLWTLPPILIIHLKRFQFLDKRWQKSHKTVRYPVRNLDLNKFIQRDNNNNVTNNSDHSSSETNRTQPGDENDAIYNLYAINCHLGSLQMGHYVTYALNKESNKWYLFNDSICKEVDEKEITMSCAYLLFYERANLNADTFLQQVLSNVHNTVPQAVEIISDEVESDIKKYCLIQ